MDYTQLIKWIWNRKYWFVLSVFVFAILGGVKYFFQKSSYAVDAKIMLRTTDEDNSTPQDDMMQMMGYGGTKQVADEIEILTSRTLLEEVIKTLNLETKYEKKSFRYWEEQYPAHDLDLQLLDEKNHVLIITLKVKKDGYKIHIKEGLWKSYSTFAATLDQPLQTPWGNILIRSNKPLERGDKYRMTYIPSLPLAVSMQETIQVKKLLKESDIIKLSTSTQTPKKAIDIINTMIDLYNAETTKDKNQLALNTAMFIEERVKIIAAELDQLEVDIENYKQEEMITDLGETTRLYIRASEEYAQKMAEVESKAQIVAFLHSYIIQPENEWSLVPSNLDIQDVTLVSLITSYNAQIIQYQKLNASAQVDNPILMQQREQIAMIRKNILQGIEKVQESLDIQRQTIKERETSYNTRLENLPVKEKKYLEMKRLQDLKEELYVYLCEKQEENALLLNSSSLPARVIDAANMDPTPLAPRFFRTIAIYMVMGGLFPLLFFFIGLLKQYLHPKRNESAQQVENWGIEWYN